VDGVRVAFGRALASLGMPAGLSFETGPEELTKGLCKRELLLIIHMPTGINRGNIGRLLDHN
jgi:hypothetical protein